MLFALAPQKRASQEKVVTFEERMTAANKAWAETRFGGCTEELKAALALVQANHREVILAAMPPAPAGWTVLTPKKTDEGGAAMAAMLGMGSGMLPVSLDYKNESGQRMSINVLINSPMIQMMTMAFSNPAYLEEGSELIEYKDDKGLLKTGKGKAELQVVLDSKHLLTCEARDQSAEWILAVMSQENIDKLKTAISR